MAWSIFTDGGGDSVAVQWAQQLLTLINAPVTPGNVQFVYDWEKSEGGGGKFNPLNQGVVYGHPEWTTTGQQYGGGAADYASWQAGLMGAASYLNTPGPDNYPAIRDALRNNNPSGAKSALFASGWAASHYGYGSNWSNALVPGATSSAVPVDFTGTTSGGTVTDTSQGGSQSDTCLFRTSIDLGVTSVGGCWMSKSAARGLLGGLLLTAGLGLTVIGLIEIMKVSSPLSKIPMPNLPGS